MGQNFVQQDDENFGPELQTDDYGSVNVFPPYVSQQRRASGDSTVANFPNDEPPPYDGDVIDFSDRKDALMGGESPPAHEIKLDDGHQGDEAGVEMVEKAHAPLYNPADGLSRIDSDDMMVDMEHITEPDNKGNIG